MKALLQEFYSLSPATYARIYNWEEMALKKALNVTDEPLPADYTDEQVELMRAYVESKKAPKQQKQQTA